MRANNYHILEQKGEISMEKLTMQDYLNCLQAKKQEAHDKQWLYIEVNAKDLLEECEPGIRNQNVCCKGYA